MTIPACRWCRAGEVAVVLDLGEQPPADLFPLLEQAAPESRWPLRMGVCPRCGLAQLLEDPGVAEEPLGREPQALIEQAAQAVAAIVAVGLAGAGTRVTEFDSPHGGSWLALLGDAGCVPAGNAPADLVVDVFGLMHDDDQAAALRRRVNGLAVDGTLLLQFHSLASIVRQRQWNALRHGHLAYYSTRALVTMLAELGLEAVAAWTFELYGGTVLLAARRAAGPAAEDEPSATLAALLAADDEGGLTAPGGAAPLADAARRDAGDLVAWLAAQRDRGHAVIGYGAASRAVPLLVHAGVGRDLLPAVADGSPAKHGRRLPVSGIPVVSADELRTRAVDVVLLFVPDLLDEVRRNYPEVEARGGRWAVSEPRPRIVERLED